MTHDELIAALEAASGPSRELDAAIWRVAEPAVHDAATGLPKPIHNPTGLGKLATETSAPDYTRSIDETLPGENIIYVKLHDDGLWFAVHRESDCDVGGTGRTEALARRIAALRARAG